MSRHRYLRSFMDGSIKAASHSPSESQARPAVSVMAHSPVAQLFDAPDASACQVRPPCLSRPSALSPMMLILLSLARWRAILNDGVIGREMRDFSPFVVCS